MIDWLRPRPGQLLLDVAGGTGDIAQRFLAGQGGGRRPGRRLRPDPGHARDRPRPRHRPGHSSPASTGWSGDAEALPFADRSVDAYTIAFGLRNVTEIDKALAEARRVLKPGGRFLCLEFSQVVLPQPEAGSTISIPSACCPGWAGSWPATATPIVYLVESIRRFPRPAGAGVAHGGRRAGAVELSQPIPAASPPSIPPGASDGRPYVPRLPQHRPADHRRTDAGPPRAPWRPSCSRSGRRARRLPSCCWPGSCPASRSTGRPGERLARALIDLGPVFIKLGQLLVHPLRHPGRGGGRGSGAAPGPSAAISRRGQRGPSIEAELRPADRRRCSTASTKRRSPPPRSPRSITPSPPEGEPVAVKVLRPGIEEAFARDIDLMFWIAEWIERSQPRAAAPASRSRWSRPSRATVRVEMDLRLEAAAAAELAENFAGDTDLSRARRSTGGARRGAC